MVAFAGQLRLKESRVFKEGWWLHKKSAEDKNVAVYIDVFTLQRTTMRAHEKYVFFRAFKACGLLLFSLIDFVWR